MKLRNHAPVSSGQWQGRQDGCDDLFDCAPAALMVVADGMVLRANPSAANLFGMDPARADELAGLSLRHDPQAANTACGIDPLQTLDRQPRACRLMLGERTGRAVLVNAAPIRWHGFGAALVAISPGGDGDMGCAATAAPAAASTADQRFRLAIDVSGEMVTIIDPLTARYVDCNQTACDLLGYTREQLLGMHSYEVSAVQTTLQDMLPIYREIIAEHPRARTQADRLRTADGRTIPMEFTRCAMRHGDAWLIVTSGRERDRHLHRLNLLHAVMDQSSEALTLVDCKTLRFIYANQQCLQRSGTTLEQFLNTHPWDSLVGGSAPAYAEMVAELVAMSPRSRLDEQWMRMAGRPDMLCEITRQALCIEGEWVMVVAARDITTRRREQRELDIVRAAINKAGDAIIVVDPLSHRYLNVNDQACRLYGLTRDEMQMLGPTEVRRRAHPQDNLTAQIALAMASPGRAFTADLRVRRGDGSETLAEATRVAVDVDGERLIVATLRDVTAQRQTQRQIERIRAAIDKAGDAITVISLDTRQYLEVNEQACQFFGHPREEMMRLGPVEIGVRTVGHPDVVTALKIFDQTARSLMDRAGQPMNYDMLICRPDGSSLLARTTRVAMRLGDEWVMVSNMRDVTDRVAAEQRLERFRAALDQAVEAIVVISRRTLHLIDLNETACRMYGLPRETLMQMPVYRFGVTFVDAKAQGDLYDVVIANSPTPMIENAVVTRPDGQTIPVEITRRAVRVGEEWLIVASTRDMTAQHQAKRELSRFRAALDKAGDAIVLIDPHTLQYIDFNETACQLFGMPREQLQRLGPAGVARALGNTGLPDEDRLRESYAPLLANPGQMRKAAITARLGDGAIHHLDYTRSAHLVEGQWVVVSVIRDVTESHKAQERFQLFRAALDRAADAILLVDVDAMSYIDVNATAAQMMGLSRDEILRQGPVGVARRIMRMPADHDHDAALRAVAADLETQPGGIALVARDMLRPDGSAWHAEIARTLVRADGRQVLVSSYRDITERLRAQAEIRRRVDELTRSNQELERFAYVASHDLSEPLRMVASYTQLLARRYTDRLDDDGREFMGYIVGGAQRMKQLIDDLLTYSRAGRMTQQLREVDLNLVLQQVRSNLGQLIADRHGVIECDGLPTVRADATSMVQLLQNLVAKPLKDRSKVLPIGGYPPDVCRPHCQCSRKRKSLHRVLTPVRHRSKAAE